MRIVGVSLDVHASAVSNPMMLLGVGGGTGHSCSTYYRLPQYLWLHNNNIIIMLTMFNLGGGSTD